MSDGNFIMGNIREELQKEKPIINKIISYLFDLRIYKDGIEFDSKDEWRYLSDLEFFDIVGEIFKLNPTYFMKNLYNVIRDRVDKLYGYQKRKNMDKFILEKFCLYPEEEILYSFNGDIHLNIIQPVLSVSRANIFITNYRIIAQGRLKLRLKMVNLQDTIIKLSIQQELPCYGYIFPINQLYSLRKMGPYVNYDVMEDYLIQIHPSSLNNDRLVEFLSEPLFNEKALHKFGWIVNQEALIALVKSKILLKQEARARSQKSIFNLTSNFFCEFIVLIIFLIFLLILII